ncbi:MAG TPA: DUF6624 domain-containing protein [Thermoanaerobaculia bacterium]|nr:DUF6624 domain-containing protein [Thermoanaerobaculia bacterium]
MPRLVLAPFVLLLILGCVRAQPQPPVATPAALVPESCVDVPQTKLCAELLELRDRDQAVRRKWMADRENEALQQEVETVDRENVVRVIEIINATGWPGKLMVGEKGSAAAWTILQHADLEVQKRYLGRMEKAVETGELHGSLLATTVDRIRVREGQPQLYGTQFREQNGRMEPFPIENEAEVAFRRAKVGLQPLSEYAAMVNQMYSQPKKP